MNKCMLVRRAKLMIVFVVVLPVVSQTNTELNVVLQEAAQAGSLDTAGTPPLQIDCTYSIFSETGKALSSGPLTLSLLRQGLYKFEAHESGTLGVSAASNPSDSGRVSFLQRLLVQVFLHPGPSVDELADSSLTQQEHKFGTQTLRCIATNPSMSGATAHFPSLQGYCLPKDRAVIRFVQERYGVNVVYNDLVNLLGHTVAREVLIQANGVTIAKLSAMRFASAPALKEADFADQQSADVHFEPVGAKPVKDATVHKVQPIYPYSAKLEHISGTVLLHILVGKDGTVEHAEVIAAPAASLAQAALDAVRQWKYTPYLESGVAKKVDAGVSVNFSFGR